MNVVKTTPNASPSLRFWQQLRWRLTLYFMLLTVGVIAIVTSFTLVQLKNQSTEQTLRQLESVAQLKQNQISRWLETGEIFLHSVIANPDLRAQVVTFVSSNERAPEMQSSLNEFLSSSVNSEAQVDLSNETIFEEIFIYNTAGYIVSGSNNAAINRVVTLQPYFEPSLEGNFITSPYYDVSNGELTAFITNPIRDSAGEIVGVIAGRLNIDVLRSITAERAGLGETGETYLVSIENNYFLTPSRFEGYSMTRAYHSEGIDQALAEVNGSGTYLNYGNPATTVLGVYRWIPELSAGLMAEISQSEAETLLTQTSLGIVGLAVILVLGAGVIGLIAATSISQPVVKLTEVATQIASGDLSARATTHQRNEIGLLGTAFNQMTNRLVSSITELDNRIEEINETNSALRVATAKAKEAARVKGEFLANVSHELRTPLNAIIGFSDMLLMGMSGELAPKQRHKMERLKENGVRLLTLINNILDITRIEMRRIDIAHKPFSPTALAERLSAQMAVLAERSNLEFQTSVATDLPETVYGDEQRIEQVIVNLLSNAFKFTEKGLVTLKVRANSDQKTWSIAVTDTGIGIPPHALNIIFEEFRQVDGSSKRAYKGTGLGLAITRNLVRMMDGEIKVDSEMGKGSTFSVTLPLEVEEVDHIEVAEKVVG
jgi:signal transduction histidine kinase